jgi:hypothetical protein
LFSLILIGGAFGKDRSFGFHPVLVMGMPAWVLVAAFTYSSTSGKSC